MRMPRTTGYLGPQRRARLLEGEGLSCPMLSSGEMGTREPPRISPKERRQQEVTRKDRRLRGQRAGRSGQDGERTEP